MIYFVILQCLIKRQEHSALAMKSLKRKYIFTAIGCVAVIVGIIGFTFFTPLSGADATEYIYIDSDDNVDSVFAKVETAAAGKGIGGFKMLAKCSNYSENIHPGRYEVKPGACTFSVFRAIKSGRQTPLMLTIPSVYTPEIMAEKLSKKLMLDSLTLVSALKNEETCRKYGHDTATIMCMFIPETYEVFWNISANDLLDRMNREYGKFWNDSRKGKAAALKLSQEQVSTMASIVDAETSNNAEKPMIAGLYYNRLNTGMPLQADPTVKFATKDFAAKRIYHNMLTVDSPYNTYKYEGLPPGPIRNPTVAGIDAVLNMVHHNYIYMCAKEDFSGTHRFAATYSEHMDNARRYSEALNARGIK